MAQRERDDAPTDDHEHQAQQQVAAGQRKPGKVEAAQAPRWPTTFMVVGAGLLLFGGVALARETQTGDDHRPQVVATPSLATDQAASPTASPEIGDDNGGNGADDSTSPTASPDDHGGHGGDDDSTSPTASPDDHGGHGGDDDSTSPTASPDDHGGHGGDDD